jgi:hypothetical protein
MNISNAKGIHAYYANRILNITRNISVIPIVWQDVWDKNVQVWFYFHITISFAIVLFFFQLVTNWYYRTSMER